MLEPCLNHCDADRIAADYARSEALGQAILDADCESEAPVPAQKSYIRTLCRKVNLVTDTSSMFWLTEAL